MRTPLITVSNLPRRGLPVRPDNVRQAVVSGAVAMRPGRGGHAWVFLNWLMGLRSIGFDVVFVDRMDEPQTVHIEWLAGVMAAAGAEQRWGLTTGSRTHGGSRAEIESWFADCDVCI